MKERKSKEKDQWDERDLDFEGYFDKNQLAFSSWLWGSRLWNYQLKFAGLRRNCWPNDPWNQVCRNIWVLRYLKFHWHDWDSSRQSYDVCELNSRDRSWISWSICWSTKQKYWGCLSSRMEDSRERHLFRCQL